MTNIDVGTISEALNNKMDLDSSNANPKVLKPSAFVFDSATGTLNIITQEL